MQINHHFHALGRSGGNLPARGPLPPRPSQGGLSMSDNHSVSKLDDLIVTLIDSVKGYEHSAEKAEAARYQGFFLEMAQDRRAAVTRLQEASRAEGGTPADYGSAAATLHRRIED